MASPVEPRNTFLPKPSVSIDSLKLLKVSEVKLPYLAESDNPLHRYTTFVTEYITISPVLAPSSPLNVNQTSATLSSTGVRSYHNVTASTTSLYQHPQWPQVGTVVDDSDIPEAWRSKEMQNEQIRVWQTLGILYAVFGLGILGVIVISWSKCWSRGDCCWQPTEEQKTVARRKACDQHNSIPLRSREVPMQYST
ncbi:hypothetical protein P153DRAFT_20614 [Dothidotthia symphoricarpi CBS 119687]|uniref:Uncharacterized protein n=1 Tax=Dothidotthia symphoricarpi CBS 119687 TaxID=1392245 RepID=A0A6A6ACE5_9PLEO|nr:uncharacterized protein P153DRAFT_20614 [Dothidotthia symphoricarpi CBS 119687]KAF2129489.1 hypothetical protein P153DRAFT_20614 [Dothidotthia symphoricarpi CBS 119687]